MIRGDELSRRTASTFCNVFYFRRGKEVHSERLGRLFLEKKKKKRQKKAVGPQQPP